MIAETYADRIIKLLARMPELDDDEIARELAIEPRQTVNQVCRRLSGCGKLVRQRGTGGKIVNRLPDQSKPLSAPDVRAIAQQKTAGHVRAKTTQTPGNSLTPRDLAGMLLVIPCSGVKQDQTGTGRTVASIIQSLPPALAEELLNARRHVKEKIAIDELTLVPARQRYSGSLYCSGGQALDDLLEAGSHVVILSGGYGLVLATEPIGMYDQVFKRSWWPQRILERSLVAYAQHHRISSVRAFASATSPYVKTMQHVRWRDADIDDALLLTPHRGPGAMRKSPVSIGEALTALRDRTLTTDWHSSYGLCLHIHEGRALPASSARSSGFSTL